MAPLELESLLEVVTNQPPDAVLGTEHGSSGRAGSDLNQRVIFLAASFLAYFYLFVFTWVCMWYMFAEAHV